MKFTDIPQYTSIGTYQVNTPLRNLLNVLKEWVEDYGLQLNPDFQRGYVWTQEQQIKYVEYLLKGGKSARVVYLNHPGWMNSYKGDFVCVDGLQRLTACSDFLNNKFPVFGVLYKDFEDRISNDVDLLVNVNNLKTKREVLQWYLEMNSGGTVHTIEELNKVRNMLQELT